MPAALRADLVIGTITLVVAVEAGADVLRMIEVSRHRRVETVQAYVRRVNMFRGHAGAKFL